MPYRTGGGGGFTGDTNMATFIDVVWQAFVTDAFGSNGLEWIQQTPTRGKGTTPQFEFLFSKGSIGSELPPYIHMQTDSKSLWIHGSDGVAVGQESFDQPNNPMSQPPADPPANPSADSQISAVRTQFMNTVVGSYDDFFLFGGLSAEYCHCVIKVSSREYRHFHVGTPTPLHSDFPADAHYTTTHQWVWLEPDNLWAGASGGSGSTNSVSKEHKPYLSDHVLPFRNNDDVNRFQGSGEVRNCGLHLHVPGGYGTEGFDWWMMTGVAETPYGDVGSVLGQARSGSGNGNDATATIKTIGDVNDGDDDVLFGCGWISGYDNSLGTTGFRAEQTFTSDGRMLTPILILLPSDFSSALRWAPVAQIPDVFRISMKGLDAEQEISVGSDTYIVFPMINKDSSAATQLGEGYSGYEGLAYKKLTADAS